MTLRTVEKPMLQRLLPSGVKEKLKALRALWRRRRMDSVERLLQTGPTEPEHLGKQDLLRLQQEYPFPPPYGYSPDALMNRGMSRARDLLALPAGAASTSFLELGCWDGMVSWALQEAGKSTVAVDRRSEGLDPVAAAAGLDFRQMDASHLELADESFDFVFSYDAFEHFERPDVVLDEMTRVTKVGGHIYLRFGPLYLSPFGEHAYHAISVPYCNVLFPDAMLNEFCRERGVPEIDFSHVNRWRLSQFHELWESRSSSLQKVEYEETLNVDHLDLVKRFPSCFRKETSKIQDLTVEMIEVLFRRTS